MTDLDWIVGISDRRADERFFHRPPCTVCRTRADVPGCRRDNLIVFDLARLDFDRLAERTANGFGRPPTTSIPFDRFDIPGLSQPELPQRPFGLAIELDPLVHSCELAQQHAGAAKLAEHVEDQWVVVLPRFTMMTPCYHLTCQRAGFEAAI